MCPLTANMIHIFCLYLWICFINRCHSPLFPFFRVNFKVRLLVLNSANRQQLPYLNFFKFTVINNNKTSKYMCIKMKEWIYCHLEHIDISTRDHYSCHITLSREWRININFKLMLKLCRNMQKIILDLICRYILERI
jgi:hypothetical protein